MRNQNFARTQNRMLERLLFGLTVIVFLILIICTILTTKWVSDIKVMATDELNVLNEVNVAIEKVAYSNVSNDEQLLVYYSDVMPIEWSIHILNTCEQRGVDPREIFAIMEQESNFDANAISDTGDYGLMQINISNLPQLQDELGTIDLLDPYQNIEAGVYWYAGIKANNHGSIEKDLMVYNQGSRGAMRLWDDGIFSTDYSRTVVEKMVSI